MTDEELDEMRNLAQITIDKLTGEDYMDAYGPEIAIEPAQNAIRLVAEVQRLQLALEECKGDYLGSTGGPQYDSA